MRAKGGVSVDAKRDPVVYVCAAMLAGAILARTAAEAGVAVAVGAFAAGIGFVAAVNVVRRGA